MPVLASKAVKRAARSGEALPPVNALRALHDHRVHLRRGQLVMVAAIPNAGKSAFAEWYASQVNVPALYFSADQDEWTTTTRLAAAITGDASHVVATEIAEGGARRQRYADALETSRVRFSFHSNPSVDDIHTELDAYAEIFDEWPALIVVDNLVNIQGSGELQTDQWIVSELHYLARATGACVMVLVHASEASTRDPLWPPTRKDILNKLSKHPELVLTLANDGERLLVAVVKTRETKSDPQAESPFVLGVDFERMQFHPTFGASRVHRQNTSNGY